MTTFLARKDVRRGLLIAVVGYLLIAAGAAYAFSLFLHAPFSGNVFNAGEVRPLSAFTNDDGTENEGAGFDPGDNGNDPIAAADVTPPYSTVARSASNVQNCTAAVAADVLHVAMTNTFDSLHCGLSVRVRNTSPRAMLYQGASVSGAPVTIAADGNTGLCIAPGAEPFLTYDLAVDPAAVPGTVWTEATAELRAEWVDVAACP